MDRRSAPRSDLNSYPMRTLRPSFDLRSSGFDLPPAAPPTRHLYRRRSAALATDHPLYHPGCLSVSGPAWALGQAWTAGRGPARSGDSGTRRGIRPGNAMKMNSEGRKQAKIRTGTANPGYRSDALTVQVWGRPPVCRFTESLTPCPSGRRNTGPEARLTGRPEVNTCQFNK